MLVKIQARVKDITTHPSGCRTMNIYKTDSIALHWRWDCYISRNFQFVISTSSDGLFPRHAAPVRSRARAGGGALKALSWGVFCLFAFDTAWDEPLLM